MTEKELFDDVGDLDDYEEPEGEKLKELECPHCGKTALESEFKEK